MTSQDELMEDAMMKEYQNDVWDIILKPERKKVVSSKQICKIKYAADRSKGRHVARGFSEKEGINSEETLALGSKVHFLQNYHGSCIHDKVGLTPDGCEDNLPELCD